MAIDEVKYDRNMTNDELKDIGTKDMVLYKRDDRKMTKVKSMKRARTFVRNIEKGYLSSMTIDIIKR